MNIPRFYLAGGIYNRLMFLRSGTCPVLLPDAVVCSQDISEFLCRSRLQVKREFNRVQVNLLECTEVAAVIDIPILCVKIAFDLDLNVNIAGIPDFYLECANLVPAGDVVATVKSVVFRFEIHQLRLDNKIGYRPEIQLHVLIDWDVLE